VDDPASHRATLPGGYRKIPRSARVSTLEMRYGRALLGGLGWAGTIGGLALCVLIFLSAYIAFDDDRPNVKPRKDGVVRLPSVPDAEVPAVPLARPPGRAALDDGGVSGPGGGAPRGGVTPGSRTTPRATAPVETTPQPPAGGGPPQAGATPAPAAVTPPPGPGGSPPSSPPTLGDTTRGVVGAVGNGVGQVSPPAGQVVGGAGDTLGGVVDALTPPPPPGR
jgi:hypothetical protein